MAQNELIKIIDFIEGHYARKLDIKEIKSLSEELKDYDYEKFINNLKTQLLLKVEYFTVEKLHNIIEEDKKLEHLRQSVGIKSFDELYEN